MAKIVFQQSRFQGIADFNKESLIPDQFSFSRSIDYRTNPRQITLLPRTVKESGSVITDLPKWADITPQGLVTFVYGDTGKIYSRSSAGSYTYLHQAAESHGNGLSFFGEDDYLYYTNDTTIGRYGPLSDSPTFSDDFLGAQGGVPTNTYSLDLEASSSQYAARADTASLSITSNLTLEAFFKPESLPAVGSSMALISKWDESGATRSYKLDIIGVSGYFGDGSDGALTISVNTTDTPIDSVCSGTISTTTLTATNASFAAGQIILIHQTRGTGAGTWMRNKIASYTAGTITLETPLNATYSTGAQVLVMKQYTNVTVNAGVTWTAKKWDKANLKGGILAYIASGTTTINGTISANGLDFHTTVGVGYLGGNGGINATNQRQGQQGEGTAGADGTHSSSANGNGGGGGGASADSGNGGGGGGGNGATGSTGSGAGGTGGAATGTTDLTTMNMGGGGGGGGNAGTSSGGNGGNGAGIVFITSVDIVMDPAGAITANGYIGQDGTGGNASGGGGGAGGSILLKAQTATLGSSTVTASGGAGGAASGSGYAGGNGAAGRIHLDYLTSYTGTTTPTLDATQDNTLVTSTTYQARLGLSNDGTASEYLTKNISITTDSWYRLSVPWVASTSTATFYLNAVSLGSSVGTFTAIHDNASTFSIGASKNGAGSYANFFDGKMDDVRVWNIIRSAGDIFNFNLTQLTGSEGGLAAYYLLNNAYTDSTGNANDLTSSGSPSFTTDVPFSGATTRLDIDQSNDGTGNNYTTPTSIIETAANMLGFTPQKDPQKSISFDVTAKGTGDVTVIIHNMQNRVIAQKTLTAAEMGTGIMEWIFDDVWRPVLGDEYHAHLISTVADTTVDTGIASNISDATFATYYQFLVSDTDFHPIKPMLNFLAIGNERYVATWDGASYQSSRIVLPAGFRVRSFAYWREFLAIGVWKGDTVYDYDTGRIYFWDGISTTFNFFIDVPEGAINAMFGSRGELLIWAGYQGNMLKYIGGDRAEKIKQVPKITKDKYVEIFPGAVTMWRTLIHFGVDGNTDSTAIEKGVYSWGSTNQMYPESLSYDYPLSTGNRTATNIKIGMVQAVGKKLLIGWQDNVSYGVDVVDSTAQPFASGTIETLIKDNDLIWKDQMALILRGDFLPLASGESVDIKYRLNQDSTWESLGAVGTEDTEVANMSIDNGRNREYEVAIDLFSTGSTSPTVLGISLYQDDLASEEVFSDSI